jgi:ubiquitin-protein ligase E3 D
MPIIYLYAEVLANIRQANLYASLETHKNEHTTINIASDKKTITVSHDGETASLYLPTEIKGTAEISIPVDRGKEMSVRLELADIKNMPSVETDAINEGPWSASDLTSDTQLRCRTCEVELLTNESPLIFKDLPSEHWAEMMDIWHCHRPQDAVPGQEKDVEDAADSKGYGSATKLKAISGVAFVDIASFLFAAQSCRNIQVGFPVSYCSVFDRFIPEEIRLKVCGTPICIVWATRRRPFPRRRRYNVQAADTLAPNRYIG